MKLKITGIEPGFIAKTELTEYHEKPYINIQESAKFYCGTILMWLIFMIIFVINWINNYSLRDCDYCVNFEMMRKTKDFLELIFQAHIVLIPTALIYGIKKEN